MTALKETTHFSSWKQCYKHLIFLLVIALKHTLTAALISDETQPQVNRKEPFAVQVGTTKSTVCLVRGFTATSFWAELAPFESAFYFVGKTKPSGFCENCWRHSFLNIKLRQCLDTNKTCLSSVTWNYLPPLPLRLTWCFWKFVFLAKVSEHRHCGSNADDNA